MPILKCVKKRIKKSKKIYNIVVSNKIKATKYNTSIYLGTYISKKNLFIFIYSYILCLSKLGSNYSKQFILISLFYLKRLIKDNLIKRRNGRVV